MSTNLQHHVGDLALVTDRTHGFQGAVEVRSVTDCQHGETLCGDCIEEWRNDWIVSGPDTRPSRDFFARLRAWTAATA